ncbi:SRC2-like protein [Tanacetum coccineum]|uniref:SRC2-like protein n=1 Tax=Tanacetum coccineum TaxID=301880 RepID=A0ABQ5CH19_9ASTR
MEYITFELSIISAKDLKKPSSANKSDQVYATAYIAGKLDRFRTPVDKKGGSEPTWSRQPMTFTINEAEALRNSLMLVIKLKAVRMFFDKNLGEVRVPIKQLMEGIRDEGKEMQVWLGVGTGFVPGMVVGDAVSSSAAHHGHHGGGGGCGGGGGGGGGCGGGGGGC